MKSTALLPNEEERLRALERYEVLDTQPEVAFDELVELAAHMLDVPIALVSLVDEKRQWFKARLGLDARETSRDISFCGHAVEKDEPLVVEDTFDDERFAHNPLVIGEPRIRFYVGFPLRTPEGFVLGTLCGIDRVPRTVTARQVELLGMLARQVVDQLEMRRHLAHLVRQAAQQAHNEAILQQSEALNRAVLESAVDGILVIDERGNVLTFNPGAEEMFGWAAADVVGRNVNMLMPSPYRAAHDGYLRRYLDTGVKKVIGSVLEVEGLRRNGERFPLGLTVSEMRVGERKLFAGITRDLSAQKKAQVELAAKNQELLAASRLDRISSRVMLAFSRRQGGSSAQQVLDILADEADYRPLAFYVFDEWLGQLKLVASVTLPPGNDPRMVRLGDGLVGSAAERGEPVIVDAPKDGSFVLDTGIGHLEPATIFAIPMRHGEKLLGVIAGASPVRFGERERGWILQIVGQVAVGLQAQRQYEELKLLSEQLAERTTRIAQQNRELERGNQLKSQFLANMSHELRTPLNAIIGFSEVLRDGLVGPLVDRQIEYVGEIFHSGSHLLALINDILDLSKIETGKMEMEVDDVPIDPLVDSALSIVREKATKGRLKLSKNVAPGMRALRGDSRRLRQIIYNLVSNAVKFTPAGGEVRVDAVDIEGDVEIAVTDTGIGIEPESLDRLFRPFEQLDGDIGRRFEGTGLGLAMVKSLVALHGGTVGVESAFGRGSRFWVRLPRNGLEKFSGSRPGRNTPRIVSPSSKRPARGGLGFGMIVADAIPEKPQIRARPSRVLVVDDDERARAILSLYLSDAGFVVETATGALDALQKIEAALPDLITLDLWMPEVDGVAFLGLLAQNERCRSVPVVIVSGAHDPGRAKVLGANAVLAKPVQRDDLLAVTRQILAKSSLEGRPYMVVVDDDPRAIKIITTYFEGEPFEVVAAYGGREAIALIETRLPDLVVVDLMMPDFSGFDLIQWLRSRPETLFVPIVVLTAKHLTGVEEQSLRKNVEFVFAKSAVRRDLFLTEVKKLLGQVRLDPNTEVNPT